MKVLIVEDEALAAKKLSRQLSEIAPEARIQAVLPSVKSTIQFLAEESVDLIFMDIQLEDGLSFQVFDSIQTDIPIIFTTAFDEYALRAFQVNGIAYLLKPFDTNDLKVALMKARRWEKVFVPTVIDYQSIAESIAEKKSPGFRKRFLVSSGDKYRVVQTNEVAYFFASQKYVVLVTQDGKRHLLDDSLDTIAQQLDPEAFFRINRTYLICFEAIDKMVKWTKGRVKIDLNPPADEDVIVSVGKAPSFRAWLGK